MTSGNGEKSRPGGATKGKDVRSVQLNREIQAQLGNQLRQMYNDVVSQGVPDKFVDLLAKLEKADDGESEDSPK
jgi:Anti-sigma factor NepR